MVSNGGEGGKEKGRTGSGGSGWEMEKREKGQNQRFYITKGTMTGRTERRGGWWEDRGEGGGRN